MWNSNLGTAQGRVRGSSKDEGFILWDVNDFSEFHGSSTEGKIFQSEQRVVKQTVKGWILNLMEMLQKVYIKEFLKKVVKTFKEVL